MSLLDIVNTILQFFGVISIIPICFALVRCYLPKSRLKKFDKLVSETEDYIQSLEEEGVFSKPSTIVYFRGCVRRMRAEAEPYRCATYCATTTFTQLKGLFSGLSKDLAKLCEQAMLLRAEISSTATDERRRLEGSAESAQTSSEPQPTDTRSPLPACVECQRISTESATSGSSGNAAGFVPPGPAIRHPSIASSLSSMPPSPPLASPPCRINPHATVSETPPKTISSTHTPTAKKRYQSERFFRRSRRVLASHFDLSRSVAQLEHTKCGMMRTADFRRVVRSRTVDSGSTCVSDSPPRRSHGLFDPAGSDSAIESELPSAESNCSLETTDSSNQNH